MEQVNYSSIMNDMTEKEAARWVAQELPKSTTRNQAIRRINSEVSLMQMISSRGEIARPVSFAAHEKLAAALRSKFNI